MNTQHWITGGHNIWVGVYCFFTFIFLQVPVQVWI